MLLKGAAMRLWIICWVCFCVFLCSCERIKTSMMLMQANTAYNQGQYEQAIELYKKLIATNPHNPQYHYQLGVAYFSAGEKFQTQQKARRLRKLGRKDLAEDLERLLTQLSEPLPEP